jgi:predicted secreted protein
MTERLRSLVALGAVAGLVLAGGAVLATPAAAGPSTTLNVTSTADTNPATAGDPCASPADVTVPSPLSLRQAVCLANNIGGTVQINLPAEAGQSFTLTFGELDLGTKTGQIVTVAGVSAASDVIDGNSAGRVFDLDENQVGNENVTLQNLTVTNGLDNTFGGAGIIAGAGNASPDTLTLSTVTVSTNHANTTSPSSTSTINPGGGLQFIGGSLTVTNSTFTGNSAGSSSGSAIAYGAVGTAGQGLSIQGSTFSSNTGTNRAAQPGVGFLYTDGAVSVAAASSSVAMAISTSKFQSNTVTETTGPGRGGAVTVDSGALSVTQSSFSGNSVSGSNAIGGALAVATGTLTAQDDRIVGNSATAASGIGLSSGSATATDDWWGCNGGPGATGCDTVSSGVTTAPRLNLTSSSVTLNSAGTAPLAVTLAEDNTGSAVGGSQAEFDTVPVTFGTPTPTGVTCTGAPSTFSGGTATASCTLNGNGTKGTGSIQVTVDNATITVPITVDKAPAITTNPADDTVLPNTTATFTAAADGFPTPTVQWKVSTNGGSTFTNVPGATSTTLSFTATTGESGNEYQAVFTNSSNTATTTAATLTVQQAPQFTSGTQANFVVGLTHTFNISASGVPDATVSESATLPSGLTFSAGAGGTATISGTPTPGSGGAYSVNLTASNGVAPDATQTLTIDVDEAPDISSLATTTFTVGTSSSFAVTTDGGFPAPALSENGALPSGVSFVDNHDGTATLSGTPATGTAGSYGITITGATGTAPDATQNFTLIVLGPPSITSVNNTTFAVSAVGSFTVTTSPGDPGATTIGESGALPTGVTFTDNGDGTATLGGTPAAGTTGSYPLTITAGNGVGTDASQSFTLTVTSVPTITSANQTTFATGHAGTFTVMTLPGFPTTTAITETGALPSGVTFVDNGDGTATLAGTPGPGTGGSYPLTLQAANTAGHTTQSFTLTVTEPPAITSVNNTTFTVGTAGTFTVTTTAGVPAGVALSKTGALPVGVTFTDNGDGTATLAGTPAAGTGAQYPITITAANGATSTQSFTLTVDEAPSFTTADHTTFTVGQNGNFVVVIDQGFPAIAVVSISGDAPSGVGDPIATTATGATITFVGTPAAGTQGSYVFTLSATNGGALPTQQTFTLTVNDAPHITSAGNTTFTVGTAGTFTVTTTAGVPAGVALTETGALPTGVTFTDNGDGTATLAGTPAAGTGNAYPITITAANGETSTQSFTLTVDEAPSFTTVDHTTFTVGQAATFTVQIDQGYPALDQVGALGITPAGVTDTPSVTADGGEVVISGTPQAGSGGSYALDLSATNGAGLSVAQSFTLTVSDTPQITSDDNTTFTAGAAGTFTVTTTPGFPTATTLSTTSPLPSGVALVDNGNGTATLSGTPAAGTGGTYPLVITAANTAGHTTQSFTLTVDESPSITSAVHTTFAVGSSGTFAVTTSGGFPTALALSETGPLPTGVTFADNGDGTATLSGTAAAGTAGSYPFTITANNGAAPETDQGFTLTVSKAIQTITVSSTPPDPAVVGGTYPLAATSDSGLTVAFSIDPSTTNSSCSLSGSTVSFDHAGSCLVDFTQSGDGTFAAAPQVQQQITIATVTTGVAVSTTPAATVFGQPVTATATITATSGTPAGMVQFTVDGTDLGSPVPVSGGSATSPPLTDSSSDPLAPSSHDIGAAFTPTDTTTYASSTGSVSLVVAQASTTTTTTVGPSSITAIVAAVAPGAGTPTGTVTFSVDGTSVGTASLSGGVATLNHVVPAGKTRQVTAVYGGDTDFVGSSQSTSRHDPTLTATVTSAHAKTHFGWYRSAVKVTFHCASNGAPLTTTCPSPVTLSHNGGGQSVTRTIMATDGGGATTSVSPINIDKTAPKVRVTGIKNGATYDGAVPTAHCVAKDALSGVAACTLKRHTSGTKTTYRATATDKAGNTTSITGSYTTLAISVEGATFTKGAFNVKANHTYILFVTATKRPTYYDAAPFNVTPFHRDRTFIAAGHDRWALGVTMINLSHYKLWNLGVKIGGVMHVVTVRVSNS